MSEKNRMGCALCGDVVYGRVRLSPKRSRPGRPRKTEPGDRVFKLCEDCFQGVVLWLEASAVHGGPV